MVSEAGAKKLEVGAVVEGKVTGIKKFGAFVELAPGKTGLVHISEVSDDFVRDISDHFKEGENIKVKILSTSPNGKMELSAKQAGETRKSSEKPKPEKVFSPKSQSANKTGSFEDMMAKFKKLSEEKLSDMGAAAENKRRRSFHRNNG